MGEASKNPESGVGLLRGSWNRLRLPMQRCYIKYLRPRKAETPCASYMSSSGGFSTAIVLRCQPQQICPWMAGGLDEEFYRVNRNCRRRCPCINRNAKYGIRPSRLDRWIDRQAGQICIGRRGREQTTLSNSFEAAGWECEEHAIGPSLQRCCRDLVVVSWRD
jgi:hypothetical protein